jgi:hypothetical protein
MKEVQDSLGQEVLTAMQTLSWTTYTFQANHHDLREILAFIEADPRGEGLLPLRHRDRLEDALKEMVRRLHNFVSAAKALEDHTRVLRKRMHNKPSGRMHRDPQLDVEAQQRIDELFIDDPLAQFVQQLRVYSLHRNLR